MTRKILVIGGTGMLGKPVAKQLKEDGFNVIVFTRNPEEARIKMPTSFGYAKGDVENIQSLKEAMAGVYGIHINLHGGKKGNDFDRVERIGTENVVKAAKESGIQKISIITGTSVNKENTWYPMTRAKYYAEEAIRNSGINYTIFRPSWFYESLPLFVRKGKATIIGNNKNKYHWLAASDYAALVSKSFIQDSANNKTLLVYGPKEYTIEEALLDYCKLKLPKVKISHVSAGMIGFIGTVTFNPMLKFISGFSKYFEGISEDGNKQEIEELLGKADTTLEEWAAKN